MEISTTNVLSAGDKQSIFRIWNHVYPKQIVYKSINDLESYLMKCAEPTHVLAKHNGEVVAWLCIFTRETERWFALIVDSNFQRQGLGKKMLSEMKALESKVNGWMTPHNNYLRANGENYRSPKDFYEKNGFIITNDFFESDILYTVKIIWQKQVEKDKAKNK